MKIVVPGTDQDLVDLCLSTMTSVDPADIILVDNSRNGIAPPFKIGTVIRNGRNMGVARAWNIGIKTALTNDETLTVCSQSVTFGIKGGADLVDGSDEWGLEYTDLDGKELEWHLNTFTVKFMRTMGYFDENFHPAYFEDTDMLYRMGLADVPSPRENGLSRPYKAVDATCKANGQAVRRNRIRIDYGSLEGYYAAKWGGPQGKERYRTPFNGRYDTNWWPGVTLAGT